MKDSGLPTGAAYSPGYVTPEEARKLVTSLDGGGWSSELKRRVQHFGYRYDYKARAVAPDTYLGELPDWLRSLRDRLQADVFSDPPDQVIANEYLPGQGISAHVDCVLCFADCIVSVSLLSGCEMIFRHRESRQTASVYLEPCSALIMMGPARYEWTHEIPTRRSDAIDGERLPRGRRISLTFRKVIHPAQIPRRHAE
jgi:alkylated DNA repair dioxygenase AlkB